jgi:hypothetical protein
MHLGGMTLVDKSVVNGYVISTLEDLRPAAEPGVFVSGPLPEPALCGGFLRLGIQQSQDQCGGFQMSDPIDRSTLWRVTPTASAKSLIERVARDEDRSIASTITRLLAEAVDRRNLDALLARAGLADAARVLEQAAIARNATAVIDPSFLDIEPRRYRKTVAEPASVES